MEEGKISRSDDAQPRRCSIDRAPVIILTFLLIFIGAVSLCSGEGTVFLRGPNERGEGSLPPVVGDPLDQATFGEFTVDIYAENMPRFAGFQLLATFLGNLGQNTAGFYVSYSTPNPDFEGRAIVHNTLFLPEIVSACIDQAVGLLSMEREFIPPAGWGDYLDKSIPAEEDLAAVNPPEMVWPGHEGLTWLMSVNYWYTSDVPGGIYTIAVDENKTIFGGNGDDPTLEIPNAPVSGSVTIREFALLGDMDGDCEVNILDLLSVRNLLNQDPASDDNWKADLNSDGNVNILDMLIIRDRLGETCGQ